MLTNMRVISLEFAIIILTNCLVLSYNSEESSLKIQRPVIASSCQICAQDLSDEKAMYCYYTYCKEIYDKSSLFNGISEAKQGTCSECLFYSDSNYNSCVFQFCKSEILTLIKSLYNTDSNKTLDSCTNKCYYEWYYYNYDYEDCIQNICKTDNVSELSLSFSMVENNKKQELSKCNACYYYYINNVFYDCITEYCIQEFFNRENLFSTSESTETTIGSCHDCAYENDYYKCAKDNCKDKIINLANKYFENKASFVSVRPKVLYTNCELCDYFYTGESLETCIYYYCKDEIIDPEGLIKSDSKNHKEAQISRCTTDCYYNYVYGFFTYDEYYVCYTYYCKDEVLAMYKEKNAKNLLKKKTKKELFDCLSCMNEYDEYDFYCFFCGSKNEIIEKENLFDGGVKNTNQGTCETCYYEEEYSYYDCVYYYCKNEILEKSKSLVFKSLQKLFKSTPLQTTTCDQCVYSFYAYGSYYYSNCLIQYCKEEILSKEVLFNKIPNTQDLTSCDSCYNYSEDDYYNCISWYCKNKIINIISSFYEIPKIETSSCQETCYAGWYFHNSNYFLCASMKCNDFINENLIQIPDFISELNGTTLDFVDSCSFLSENQEEDFYYDCLYTNGKEKIMSMLSKSIKNQNLMDCKVCYEEYHYGKTSRNDFWKCEKVNCDNDEKYYVAKAENIVINKCGDCIENLEIGFISYEEYTVCVDYYSKNGGNAAEVLAKYFPSAMPIKSVKLNLCVDCFAHFSNGFYTENEYETCSDIYCSPGEKNKVIEIFSLDVEKTKANNCELCFEKAQKEGFDENFIYTCGYYSCKSQILEKFQKNYRKISDFITKSNENLNECWKCIGGDGEYGDCWIEYCKEEVFDKVKMNSLSNLIEKNEQDFSRCDNCEKYYNDGYYSYSDYYYCYYWYCKYELLTQTDLYIHSEVLNQNNDVDIGKYWSNQCSYYYSNGIYGYDSYYCKKYDFEYSKTSDDTLQNSNNYLVTASFALGSLLLGVLTYRNYIKRNDEEMIQYTIILN
ncbi:hypothetical protein SteCoe_6015 [Stentor coeruleus]|uniref:Uncharacterized protein n=1 Tax=Stentor coeruleus TaxID=5963 RepID=A0A1R2CR16_9CILI|nr:hypothetical protein SteCoe_6015 [Stentor coeruleus]